MSRIAISFMSTVATGIFGLVLARTSMEDWLLSTYEASPFNTVLSFLVAAAFGACASWALNEWRLGRAPLGKRLDKERNNNKELRRQLAAASVGMTPDEKDDEIQRLNDELVLCRAANARHSRMAFQNKLRDDESRKRARSKFSKLTHEEAKLVYALFKGRPILVDKDNAIVVASVYRAGAIENLAKPERGPEPGCFVRARDEWTKLLNEYEDEFKEVHGV